jgi:hemoglobin
MSVRPATLPEGVEPYRRIGPFGQADLPAGLLRSHNLAAEVWGLLSLEKGQIAFVWEDGSGDRADLVAPAEIVIPPKVLHHLEATGECSLAITFLR